MSVFYVTTSCPVCGKYIHFKPYEIEVVCPHCKTKVCVKVEVKTEVKEKII